MWEETQEETKVPCCLDSGLWRKVMLTEKLIFIHLSELSLAGEFGGGGGGGKEGKCYKPW